MDAYIRRTPLVRFDAVESSAVVYLKLENLHPIGSFKLRGAGNAMLKLGAETLSKGVWTASAGNMAQGVGWFAKRLGIPFRVLVPESIEQTKLKGIQSLGGEVELAPFETYQQIQVQAAWDGVPGTLIHPFANRDVIAGNGTIGLEIIAALPEVDIVLVPYGGGGLSCGIAAALRGLGVRTRVVAVEVETGAPLSASLAAGAPQKASYRSSFVTGMGAPFVFPQMWPLASRLIDDVIIVSLEEVAAAIRLLALRAHVVAEGAGAVALAAVLGGKFPNKKVVCIVSGGNIDPNVLATILQGGVP